MSGVINLFVIVAIGVILADLVAHADGTKAIFAGVAGLWQTSVNGMLGNPPAAPAAPAPKKP